MKDIDSVEKWGIYVRTYVTNNSFLQKQMSPPVAVFSATSFGIHVKRTASNCFMSLPNLVGVHHVCSTSVGSAHIATIQVIN